MSMPNSANSPRIMLISCVRCWTSRSRVRCIDSAARGSGDLTGTNRMVGRVTAFGGVGLEVVCRDRPDALSAGHFLPRSHARVSSLAVENSLSSKQYLDLLVQVKRVSFTIFNRRYGAEIMLAGIVSPSRVATVRRGALNATLVSELPFARSGAGRAAQGRA